jgi:hypothetical protein
LPERKAPQWYKQTARLMSSKEQAEFLSETASRKFQVLARLNCQWVIRGTEAIRIYFAFFQNLSQQ